MSSGGLEVHDLRIERGERVLFNALSFRAPPSTLIHLQGPNGSGKTTLLRVLTGLIAPDHGEVRWAGAVLPAVSGFAAALNFVGHHGGLNAELSPRENLTFIAALTASVQRCDIDTALARLDALEYAESRVRYLSAGQRQRVVLARLVLFEAVLWLLDEPFTALDQAARALIEALIDAHVDNGGIVLIATHQMFQTRHRVQAIALAARPT